MDDAKPDCATLPCQFFRHVLYQLPRMSAKKNKKERKIFGSRSTSSQMTVNAVGTYTNYINKLLLLST